MAEHEEALVIPSVVALDLSLTSTGWADGLGYGVLVPPASANRGIPRLQWIRSAVLGCVGSSALVVLEGYAFAARGRAIISLGELGGVIRCALADNGIAGVDVPPSSRALFATGKGNASKENVLAEAIRKLGYPGHSNDEADALWLRRMALAHYAGDATKLNEKQRKALASIDWPLFPSLAPALADDNSPVRRLA